MRYTLFDIEADGLLYPEQDAPVATMIHCMCCTTIDTDEDTQASYTFTSYESMAAYLQSEDSGILIGHNIIRYDIPMLEKFLGIQITKLLIDTLALSWYLYPNRARTQHNLNDWGEDLGIQKVAIDDWTSGNIENIIIRCQEDVKITVALFHKQLDYLRRIYEGMSIMPFLEYLSFKMDCAAEQEKVRWKVDKASAESNLALLVADEQVRVEALVAVMPPVPVFKTMKKPKNIHRKDGTLSKAGERWLSRQDQEGLRVEDTPPSVKVANGTKPGHPTTYQLKKWLTSLGWEPITFKYQKTVNDDGTYTERPVPQMSLPDGSGLCPSVKIMFEDHPELEQLDGLFTVTSRKNNLKAILEYITEDGFVTASIIGLTNTLRFQHGNPLVNLPGTTKRYGEFVRSVLIAPEGHILCGSDMKSLEDSTKRHYMWNYDPEYVKEMMAEDYDPHLDIGLQAKMVTAEEVEFYKWYEKTYEENKDYPFTDEQKKRKKQIGDKRKNSKQVNFSAVYGASPKKIHLTSRMPMDLANKLHAIYWKRNWSVKKLAEDIYYKTVDGQMWMYNPVSHFWYSLRYTKDIFSTLNQGTGVFCFDTQVRNVRKRGLKLCGQFHDEFVTAIPLGSEEEVRRLCNEAIAETNEKLKLNVTLGISIQFGPRYSDIH